MPTNAVSVTAIQIATTSLRKILLEGQEKEALQKYGKAPDHLQSDVQAGIGNAAIISCSSAMPQSSASVSLQERESGFVGQAIISAETQLKTWINAETPEVRPRVIAIYGMPGVGKTTLLERVYK